MIGGGLATSDWQSRVLLDGVTAMFGERYGPPTLGADYFSLARRHHSLVVPESCRDKVGAYFSQGAAEFVAAVEMDLFDYSVEASRVNWVNANFVTVSNNLTSNTDGIVLGNGDAPCEQIECLFTDYFVTNNILYEDRIGIHLYDGPNHVIANNDFFNVDPSGENARTVAATR